MKRYPKEREEGAVEYKSRLTSATRERVERLASQMKYRLAEGGGEAIYLIGVEDDGTPRGLTEDEERETLRVLGEAASLIGAQMRVVERRPVAPGRRVVRLLVRVSRGQQPVQVIVAALGNVDAGKSTLVGVLCTGELDDGRGRGMRRVARFLHEVESGRTSSVAVRLLGFGMGERPVNWDLPNPLDEAQVYLGSSKLIYFVDLGGHERYLRTTLRGVMAKMPDYVMLVVAANNGLLKMGREHLGIAAALRIPVFAVITKIDIASRELLEATLGELADAARHAGRKVFLARDRGGALRAAELVSSGAVMPVFTVSSVTGEGLERLVAFLSVLPPRRRIGGADGPLLLYIDDIFNVRGVGTVVAGLIESGVAREDSYVYLGPFADGAWRRVRVKSIHVNRVPVSQAVRGEEATLALAGVEYGEVEKGMALSSAPLPTAWGLTARVFVLRHPTTIRVGYETVLHYRSVRSPVRFEWMEREPMRTGDVGLVELRFTRHPWPLRPGERFLLRDSRTRALGRIVELRDVVSS